MKTTEKKIVVMPRAEFSRGFVEGEMGKDFVRIHLNGNPDYDYANYSLNDIRYLANCIDWLLSKLEPEEQLDGEGGEGVNSL